MRKRLLISLLVLAVLLPACEKDESNFILWQLPSRINTIGNSYVFLMDNGKVAVMDGGVAEEAEYLAGFLAALGNEVEAWFISHPHLDHMGALNEILQDPGDLVINTVYHSEYSEAFYSRHEVQFDSLTRSYYKNLHASGIRVVDVEPGQLIEVDRTRFRILSVKNEDITVNPYNNSSMTVRVWDPAKSMVFLGDLGAEGGDRLLQGPFRDELDCDYLQMAHHGQRGVSQEFYRTVKFRACLWPTPSWVYNNDQGQGYNTGNLKTMEVRELVDSLGITEQYRSFEGLAKIE